MSPLILALALLQFTGSGGQRIYVNPEAVSTVREPTALPDKHFVKGTHCVIVTMNGKFVAVREDCGVVHRKLQAVGRKG